MSRGVTVLIIALFAAGCASAGGTADIFDTGSVKVAAPGALCVTEEEMARAEAQEGPR